MVSAFHIGSASQGTLGSPGNQGTLVSPVNQGGQVSPGSPGNQGSRSLRASGVPSLALLDMAIHAAKVGRGEVAESADMGSLGRGDLLPDGAVRGRKVGAAPSGWGPFITQEPPATGRGNPPELHR